MTGLKNCFVGIELGFTRIKAVLIDGRGKVLASGGHEWKNRLENGLWTYSYEDITSGLQAAYGDLKADIHIYAYGVKATTAEDIAVSGTRNIISDGASYTSGIFNRFEFPFVSTGFDPADVPTDKPYAQVSDEEGVVFGTSSSGGPGGGPGGNPGGNPGGGGDFVFTFDTYTWNTAENSFQLKAGSHVLLSFTANRNAAPTEGSTYSFTLQTNDTGAPFAIDCTLELKTDNTAVFHCGASGPLSDTTQRGTWSEAEGVVTINLK